MRLKKRGAEASWMKDKLLECGALRGYAPVAQLDRVLDYESSGREFESLRARQLNQVLSLKHIFRNFTGAMIVLGLKIIPQPSRLTLLALINARSRCVDT